MNNIQEISFANYDIIFSLHEDEEYISDFIRKENSFYELDHLEILNYLPIKNEGAFVDIGANIGNHTTYYAKVMNRDVYAFEPIKENYKLLKNNILLNKIDNKVKSFNVALGNIETNVYMSKNYKDNSGTWSVKSNNGDINFLKKLGYKVAFVAGRSSNAIFIHASAMDTGSLDNLQNFIEQLKMKNLLMPKSIPYDNTFIEKKQILSKIETTPNIQALKLEDQKLSASKKRDIIEPCTIADIIIEKIGKDKKDIVINFTGKSIDTFDSIDVSQTDTICLAKKIHLTLYL